MVSPETQTLLALLVPLLLVGLSAICLVGYRSRCQKTQHLGVHHLLLLKELLMALQQHRGLSYGALNGDPAMRSRLPGLDANINRQIEKLKGITGIRPATDHWIAFNNHWQRLQPRNLELTAENNLTQHNRLITVVLYLIENVAEACLLSNEIINDGERASILWQQVLVAAEWLGQARALGSGVIASGVCGSVERIRMSFIRSRIESAAQHIQHQFPDPQILQRTLGTIDLQFLEREQPDIPAREYFELISQAIDKVLAHFDERMQGLADRLGQRDIRPTTPN